MKTPAFQLHILHTSDVHSHFEMFPGQSNKSDDVKNLYGGVARRAGFIRDFRKNHKNVVLLDAGDQYQGTLWFNVYKGSVDRHFLDYMQYDAMALGNHEFDNGLSGLSPLLDEAKTPILCCNLVRDSNATAKIKDTVKSHVVVTRENMKIGIIGYLTAEVIYLANTEKLSFFEEAEAIAKEAKMLKSNGVDIVIALGHSGISKDIEMAKVLVDVDVIVGGHSHTLLYNGKNKVMDEVFGEYPLVFNHGKGRKTLVVHSGCHGKYIGVLQLNFDSKGNLSSWSGNPVLMDESISEDKEAKEYLDMLKPKIDGLDKDIVGRTNVMLDSSAKVCRTAESIMGNMYTDSMVFALQEKRQNVAMAIAPGASIRASIDKGDITHGNLLRAFPFGNQIVAVSVDGRNLRAAFEHSVSGYDVSKPQSKFLQVSGFKVTYDVTKPDGSKVVELKAKRSYDSLVYEDVDENETYEVAMSDSLSNGGDGYVMFKSCNNTSLDILDVEVVLKFVKTHSPITPKLEGRIKIVSKSA